MNFGALLIKKEIEIITSNIYKYYSLCTTLCLQWEPEIIAVSLMYLACKLSKFELNDWQGRTPNHLRWWDMFVQGMNMDLLEGKLYSSINYIILKIKMKNSF